MLPVEMEQKRILIVSSSDKSFEIIASGLDKAEFSPIERANDSATAHRMLSEKSYDMLLINSPLKDESGIELAINAAEDEFTGVILFVKSEYYDEVSFKVCRFGVLTLGKPVTRGEFQRVIMLSIATRERLKRAEKKSDNLMKKMKEIRTVTRAKCLLIEKLGLSEQEAHRLIEKQAMDMRRTRTEIAEALIRTYEN